jgi:hypothetical protein
MTPLSVDPPLRTPPVPDAAPGAPAAVRSAAAPAVQLEHAQDRWSRWLTTRDRDDDAARRRLYVIAGVIVLGLLVWAFWTL